MTVAWALTPWSEGVGPLHPDWFANPRGERYNELMPAVDLAELFETLVDLALENAFGDGLSFPLPAGAGYPRIDGQRPPRWPKRPSRNLPPDATTQLPSTRRASTW